MDAAPSRRWLNADKLPAYFILGGNRRTLVPLGAPSSARLVHSTAPRRGCLFFQGRLRVSPYPRRPRAISRPAALSALSIDDRVPLSTQSFADSLQRSE